MPDVLETLKKLPLECAAHLPGSGEPILIRRGVAGYYPLPSNLSVENFNQRRNVTPIQAEAMMVGSMMGWEVPGADPDTYELDEAGNVTFKKEVCNEQ